MVHFFSINIYKRNIVFFSIFFLIYGQKTFCTGWSIKLLPITKIKLGSDNFSHLIPIDKQTAMKWRRQHRRRTNNFNRFYFLLFVWGTFNFSAETLNLEKVDRLTRTKNDQNKQQKEGRTSSVITEEVMSLRLLVQFTNRNK